MNKTILIGRVTKDIDLKTTMSGKSVVQFTLAINRDYKNAEGNYDADFIPCVAFEQRAGLISKYVHKGDKLGVFGSIRTRTFDKNDGSKGYVTEVIVEGFEFLEPKKDKLDVAVPNEAVEFEEVTDDDIPF